MALSIAAFAVSSAAIGGSFDDEVERDVAIQAERGAYLAAGILQALGVAVLFVVLRYLYRVTKYRREELPGSVWPLATAAPLALGVFAIVGTFQRLGAVERVTEKLPLPPEVAIELSRDEQATGGAVITGIGGSIAALSIAAAFILLSQNARKAGLLSNFIGIIGIIVGAFLVLGPLLGSVLGPIPIVQWFWLSALALLFLGRWPGGRPPAWETGEEEPWPTAQEIRQQREAEGGGRARRKQEPEEEYEDLDEEPDDAEPATPAHPRSKKRKRKRKR
ncbi:MAG TPA: hypothetical protein VF712_17460 [Thermoleophilaceae bacterium]